MVIEEKEYAYGGHDRRNVSGVYWAKPGQEPPGGTFRCEILQGFALRSRDEIDNVIREVNRLSLYKASLLTRAKTHQASHKFQGPTWNLLTKNCNHFTSYLCQELTGRPAPAWLNRAASIGIALPCVVPRELLAPPDAETADGELVEDDEANERTAMLRTGHLAVDDSDDDSSEQG